MIDVSSGRASLSNTISSPLRGRIVKPPPPNIRSTSSLASPAALTANRQRTGSAPGATASSNPSPPPSSDTPVTRVPSRRSTPARTASIANASGTDHGSMTHSSGIHSPPSAPGPRFGSRW